MTIIDSIKTSARAISRTLFNPAVVTPAPGLYHYRREEAGSKVRLHLRLDPDGQGLLIVNANRVYHLNPTAALMAYLTLEKIPGNQVIQTITHRYQVTGDQARSDYAQISSQINELIRPDGACPICELSLETTLPFTARPSAPYRMDLALTYRCNNNCSHCYNARPRNYKEISTADWKRILDQLWQLGIPHIVFTGGEPTLRTDLPELIAHAEKNGQITGINTNGRRLNDRSFLANLIDAGLDHVQITLESHDSAIHDDMVSARGAWQQTASGLKNALASPLYVMTNTTLLQANSAYLAETLEYLSQTGVPTVGLNALIYSGRGLTVGSAIKESSLPPLLTLAQQHTSTHGQRLIWYTPTQYCHFDPIQMELGVKGCTAALYNMCIEPDGSVIPCQSYYQPLGNLLFDSWDSIWNHEMAVSLRERRDAPAECASCQIFAECGGGCPLARQAIGSDELKPTPIGIF